MSKTQAMIVTVCYVIVAAAALLWLSAVVLDSTPQGEILRCTFENPDC